MKLKDGSAMNIFMYQIMNMLLIIALLGAPVAVAVVIFRHFNKKDRMIELEARLTSRINELEERIEQLEEVQ